MLVGYMRVSSESDRQITDLQRDALLAAGVDGRHLFEDHASGAKDDRLGLNQALTFDVDQFWIRCSASMMIQTVLAQPHWQGKLTPRDYAALTPLIWEHVNPYGRFDLDMNARLALL